MAALAVWSASARAEETVALVQSNAVWKYFKGRSEPSPEGVWRQTDFDDGSWPAGRAPFFYGEPLEGGTVLGDMRRNYATVYLRRAFTVERAEDFKALLFEAACDDGFVAWLNGVEIARLRAPSGALTHDAFASSLAPEPAGFQTWRIDPAREALRSGRNTLAVQVFNISLTSSDLVFDARLLAERQPPGAPVIVSVDPPPGPTTNLARVEATFNKPVGGVDAEDLLMNGEPALSVSGGPETFVFLFAPPRLGDVQMAWWMNADIRALGGEGEAFDPSGPGATWRYWFYDPSRPSLVSVSPPVGAELRALSQVEVFFDRPVTGVDAGDLLINGAPALAVLGAAAGPYRFQFPAQPAGEVALAWSQGHGIADALNPGLEFVGRPWTYTVNPDLPAPRVLIAEFMAQNVSGLRDEDGQTEDWIELWNAGDSPVNLEGWSLTDDPDVPGKWRFPALTLDPDERLIVFASGKDRRQPAGNRRLHANFKLGLQGEYLGLYAPDQPDKAADELAPKYPEQRNDYSYGRDPLGRWGWYRGGSPGRPNGWSVIRGEVEPVRFSVQRGFYYEPIQVVLSCPTPGAVIRYTLDGSPPTEESGTLYEGPVRLFRTSVLRVAAFKPGLLPTPVQTHTYLFRLPARFRSVPVLSLVTDRNNLFGPTGIMEVQPRNTTKHGLAWERPVSAEWIPPDGKGDFQVDCGIRIHGGGYIRKRYDYHTSAYPQGKYSFRLYFRGDYGPGRLEKPIFPETPLASFDTIVLRAGMNDPRNPFIRDELARRLLADAGQVSARGAFVQLFLNGLYKGYYNPTERIDIDFLQSWLGGGRDWDLVAQDGVREGNDVSWNALRSLIRNLDLSKPDNYRRVEALLDTTNFVDYLLVHIYADTDDWPHNNWRAARERRPGAKWRFYMWDAEWSFGFRHSVSHNTLAEQLGSPEKPWGGSPIQEMFLNLKESPEFRLLFADRVHRHMFHGGALTDERIRARYEWLKAQVTNIISGFDDSIGRVWIRSRRRYLTNYLAQAGLFASDFAPDFEPFGGAVPRGYRLELKAPRGEIYYTLDGTDPRERLTGALSPGAKRYTPARPLILMDSIRLCARARDGAAWSALSQADFTVQDFGPKAVISEIMYHPPEGEPYEFLEIYNPQPYPADLSGWALEGVQFVFPRGTAIPPGGRAVIASDAAPELFRLRYPGVEPLGWFAGSLSNGGERVEILDDQGRPVFAVRYEDDWPWPPDADGGGASLELIDPGADSNNPAAWRAGPLAGGTPGAPPSPQPPALVRLSEIHAAAAASPDADPWLRRDWIELRSASFEAVDLSGWTLEKRGAAFVFPEGTRIAPGETLLVVCGEETLGWTGLVAPFGLPAEGGTVWLRDRRGRLADIAAYGPQVPEWTAARNEGSDAWELGEPTPGGPNESATPAAASQIRLNEWMADSPPGGEDWIELYNLDPERAAALSGLWIEVNGRLARIPSPSACPAGGFVVLAAGERPGHLDLKLPASGGAVRLLDALGRELDRVEYPAQIEGVSFGRMPDGGGELREFPGSASPGEPNYLRPEGGLRFSELMARNLDGAPDPWGRPADWIELENAGDRELDLGGAAIQIDDRDPWRFAPGARVPPGGRLVVWADPAAPEAVGPEPPFNLGRGLPGEGARLMLWDAQGRMADAIEFGPQLPNRAAGVAGDAWTLLEAPTPGASNAAPAQLGDPSQVRINEWRTSGGEDWIELYNPEPAPVDLAGMTLTDDPSVFQRDKYRFPAVSLLPARGWGVWRAEGGEGPDELPFRLDALGELVRLYEASGRLCDETLVGLTGAQVEGRAPDGAAAIVSLDASPSPGFGNYLPLRSAAVNEVMPSAVFPQAPAVELRNLSQASLDIGGWALSDDPAAPEKYRFPEGTVVPQAGYLVVSAADFEAAGAAGLFHPDRGGTMWLTVPGGEADPPRRAFLRYGPGEPGLSYGRVETAAGPDAAPLERPTLGAPNAPPRVGPIVIQEIMFAPPGPDSAGFEYVELANLGKAPADLTGWRLAGGVEAELQGAVLPPDGLLLVVGFDPADAEAATAFLNRYGLPEGDAVFLRGPWKGRLADEGEEIRLERPAADGRPGVFVAADRVDYRPDPPWPTASVRGLSLQKTAAGGYGNEPRNWIAAGPTPLAPNAGAEADADGDGMPDGWEARHGLDPFSAAADQGAAGDSDGDGITNREEFEWGTDPRRFEIRILSARVSGARLRVRFRAAAGVPYRFENAEDPVRGPWELLSHIEPLHESSDVDLWVPVEPSRRAVFFRVRAY